MKKINILICSGGKRVDLIKEFKSVLKKTGKVMITDANELNAGKFFADRFFHAPRLDDKAYLPFMKKIIKENNITLIFSVIDPELILLAKYKEIFSKLGAETLISPLSSVKITNDKRITSRFFQKLGLLTPKVYKTTDRIHFPVFIKPYDGSGSKFAFPVKNRRELSVLKNTVPHPIILEFIKGQEYTIDCLSDLSGNILNIIPRKRLEVNNGISVKSIVDLDENIIKETAIILKAVNARGPSTIQLIKTPSGKRYFIELNLRFGGGAMLGIKSGGDYAKKIVGMLRGKKYIYSNKAVKNNYKMVAYLEHKFDYEP